MFVIDLSAIQEVHLGCDFGVETAEWNVWHAADLNMRTPLPQRNPSTKHALFLTHV
jgi:hypothetical protein